MCPTNEYGEYIRPSKSKLVESEIGVYVRTKPKSNQNLNEYIDVSNIDTSLNQPKEKVYNPTTSEFITIILVSFAIKIFILYVLYGNSNSDKISLYEQSVFTTTNLNARAGPSNSSEIKHVFDTGTLLFVLDQKGYWIKVTPVESRLKSITGEVWVHQSYVEASKLVRTTEYLNARANSNLRADILFVFQPDTELKTLSRLNNWYLVEPVDREIKKQVSRAWVYGDYLTDR